MEPMSVGQAGDEIYAAWPPDPNVNQLVRPVGFLPGYSLPPNDNFYPTTTGQSYQHLVDVPEPTMTLLNSTEHDLGVFMRPQEPSQTFSSPIWNHSRRDCENFQRTQCTDIGGRPESNKVDGTPPQFAHNPDRSCMNWTEFDPSVSQDLFYQSQPP
ncbi:hypothetical protein FE257_006538 [Aspergillus nanangensis]|uniref:Uncharacterized protein n=1 Tax=Aspergillus nanangensis TaxID=2582783 RepID=A0AAD4CXQ6_ASPNN|nr:hypothetical protein FE257_006538 [Aspergillus nanangensis]QGW49091.1 hypothetical protein FE257_006538 [Aspergillus nanangensis]